MAKKVVEEKKECICTEECKCKEKEKVYFIPEFSYWEEVVITPDDYELDEGESTNGDFVTACFFAGSIGKVIDAYQYGEDETPRYAVQLTSIDWEKVIYIGEEYLEYYDPEIEQEYSAAQSVKNLAKEKLLNPETDLWEQLIARVILDAFDKADKYDTLKK